MHINSCIFNGPASQYTLKAQEIVDLANKLIEESSAQLKELEENIQRQERSEYLGNFYNDILAQKKHKFLRKKAKIF